jgi:transposase
MDVVALSAENDQLRQENETLTRRIQELLEALRLQIHRQYGASSEQTPPDQARLFDEPDEEVEPAAESDAGPATRPQRARRRGTRLSPNLPRVEVVHDLSDEEKICSEHGCELAPMGEETSEQLEFIPAQVRVIKNIRKKYTCPACEGNVVTAKAPPQLIPKSMATPSLLAWIAVSKYADALPLYRQCTIFERIGFEADRTTFANWMITCGERVQPLINLLADRLREAPYLHLDETTLQVLKEPGRDPQSKSWMWVSAAGPPGARTVLFHYHASRGQQVAKDLLAGYQGAVMVDGYEAYDAACQANGLLRLGCWAHARRRFVEAQRLQPKGKTGKADQALALINRLYAIERGLKNAQPPQRYEARQQEAKPVLEQLHAWLEKTLPRTPPKTALGKAMSYLHGQWPRLVRYLDDGRWPIDNNPAENAIRPFTVGRKNWLCVSRRRSR